MALTSSFGQSHQSRKRARSSLEIDPSAPIPAKSKKVSTISRVRLLHGPASSNLSPQADSPRAFEHGRTRNFAPGFCLLYRLGYLVLLQGRGEGSTQARKKELVASESPRSGGSSKNGSAKSAKSANGRRADSRGSGRRRGGGAGRPGASKRDGVSACAHQGAALLEGGLRGGVGAPMGTTAASLMSGGGMHARLDAAAMHAPQRRKPCNCKNSRCLKLYCECFAAGVYCEGA